MEKNEEQSDMLSADEESELGELSQLSNAEEEKDETSESDEYSVSTEQEEKSEDSSFGEFSAAEEDETDDSESDESICASDEFPIEIHQENTPMGYFAQIRHEIVDYLNIVALPGIPSNALWRLLNLWEIPHSLSIDNALLPYVAKETVATSITVGPVIFLTASLVDALRTMYQYDQTGDLNLTHQFDPTYCQAWLLYWNTAFNKYHADKSYIDSLLLGFKFFMAALGWTLGDSFFFKSPLLFQTLGAGAGNALGLFVACFLANLLQYYRGKDINEGEHWLVSTLKVSFAGFFEGVAWSIISDVNIYRNIMKYISYNTYGINMIKASASFLDSLAVGIGSSIAFSFSPIFSVSIERFLRYSLSYLTYQTSSPANTMMINEEITETSPRPTHCCLSFFSHSTDTTPQDNMSETTHLLPRDNSMHNLFSMTNADFEDPQEYASDEDSDFYDDSEEDESAWCRGGIACNLI